MSTASIEIGRRIAEARGEWSQQAFAAHMGISQSTLSTLERGLVPQAVTFLRTLALKGGLDLNYIVAGKKNGSNGR